MVTEADLEQLKVEILKSVQEIVNEGVKNLNDYTDGLHGNSTQDITKLNAAVMDLSTDYYGGATDDSSEEGAN